MYYFDNHTAAQPLPEVLEVMRRFLKEFWGHPTAWHAIGQESAGALQRAEAQIHQLLGTTAQSGTLLMSVSGKAAIQQMALLVFEEVAQRFGKNHFVIAAEQELEIFEQLGERGCYITRLQPNEEGLISVEALAEALQPKTALVSVAWAEAQTGVVQPIEELGALCRSRGVLFHTDATQALGKVFGELGEMPVDFVSADGAPLHGPLGSGLLYCRKQAVSKALASAFSVTTIGLGQAAQLALEQRDLLSLEGVRLRQKLEQGVLAAVEGVEVLFKESLRLPTTTVLQFEGVQHESLLWALNRRGVCAGLAAAPSALVFTLSRLTTDEEIDEAIGRIADAVAQQRLITRGVAYVGAVQ